MSNVEDLFGERCVDYDPDCATCFVYKLHDEIEKLRAALKPFAVPDWCEYATFTGHDLRRAAAALKETGDE